MEADVISLFFLNTLSPYLFYLLPMITHYTGLSNFLSKIRSPEVVYNAEEEDYLDGLGVGVTNMAQQNMDTSDSKSISNPSSKKVRIFRIEEVGFCTVFVGGVPGNKIGGLMKGDNRSCKNYKTHADREKGDVESASYLTLNDPNLLLKPLVSLII